MNLLFPHRGGALVAEDDRGFEDGRQYCWAGEWYDSVTSILAAGVSKGDIITRWATKVAGEYAVGHLPELMRLSARDLDGHQEAVNLVKRAPWEQRDKAGDAGTAVHDYIEALILGETLPGLEGEALKKAQSFERWLKDYRVDFVAAEAWVYSPSRRYAGRLDAIGDVPGLGRTLMDWKTGKRVYPEVSLQLAALRFADFIGLADGTEVPMPQVDGCAVLRLGVRSYRFETVAADDHAFRVFLYAQALADWRKTSQSAIGPVIAPCKYAPRPSAPVNVASMLD